MKFRCDHCEEQEGINWCDNHHCPYIIYTDSVTGEKTLRGKVITKEEERQFYLEEAKFREEKEE